MGTRHYADHPGDHLSGMPSWMPTAAERLQFVVRFAQMTLDPIRPGDLLNLRDDFMMFFGVVPDHDSPQIFRHVFCMPSVEEHPSWVSEETIRSLQQDTQRIVASLVNLRERTPEGAVIQNDLQLSVSLLPLAQPGRPGPNLLHFYGNFRDLFLMTMLIDLSQEPTDRILRCPECPTIFYRIRKQQYCSRRCVNRANVRHWRQSEHGQQEEGTRARKRYEKKVERRTNKNVKPRKNRRRTRKSPPSTEGLSDAETPRES